MLDAGLVLYVGLLTLLAWRLISGWRLCGKWLEYANYCILLYLLLFALNVWGIIAFVRLALRDEGKMVFTLQPQWLKPLMLGAPVASMLTFLGAFIQTGYHVDEIRRGAAVLEHDRAVQIIALPAVYCCMAMNSLTKVYQAVAQFDTESTMIQAASGHFGLAGHYLPENSTASQISELYLAQTETCYQVADVYEAWALVQFCRLTMDILRTSLKHIGEKALPSDDRKKDAAGLLVAHSALDAISYTGVMIFLVVSIMQAGWSLYLLTFTHPTESNNGWADYNGSMAQFGAAGFIASAAAIYNVTLVETQFHRYFEDYGPLLKFFTVKFLLSLAYFQSGIFHVIQAVTKAAPDVVQNVVHGVPFLHQLVTFDKMQFYLFFSSLVSYECLLTVILHYFAWPANEPWYGPVSKDSIAQGDEDERARESLVDKTSLNA
eukprot:TRINITY_DN762_c5_g1_i1.p1 TRINITY_DN762_c5_g1~~TRINITY_DN762_c5_g1_i1.p1  ORF type:complete len:434 (-),score=38.82 TRINITY_DN762_c5_g1_i1:194-1495(-)